MILRIFGINTPQLYQPGQPVRDPAYLRFIRRFPCIGCGTTRRIEAMHTGPHGLGQKSSDLKALPGCHQCHLEYDAKPGWFIEKRQLDREELIGMFNHLYELKTGKTLKEPEPAEPVEGRAA